MRRSTIPTAAVAAAMLAAPVAAQAHVTLQPGEAAAGGFARIDVRVPNERDDAGTTKVVLRMPDGFASVSYEPVPGWDVKIKMEEAPEPIELHGEEVTEQVDTVTFSGGVIEPGEFQDFGLSTRVPEGEAGDVLEFPAVQTYQGGEVVRWIGPEDADEPAPTLTLAAAEEEHGATSSAQEPAAEEVETAPAAATTGGDDDGGNGLAIVALIVGGLGLAAGIGGLLAARRANSAERSGGRVATQP